MSEEDEIGWLENAALTVLLWVLMAAAVLVLPFERLLRRRGK